MEYEKERMYDGRIGHYLEMGPFWMFMYPGFPVICFMNRDRSVQMNLHIKSLLGLTGVNSRVRWFWFKDAWGFLLWRGWRHLFTSISHEYDEVDYD